MRAAVVGYSDVAPRVEAGFGQRRSATKMPPALRVSDAQHPDILLDVTDLGGHRGSPVRSPHRWTILAARWGCVRYGYDPRVGAPAFEFARGTASDVDVAVRSARAAFLTWRDRPSSERAEVLYESARVVRQHAAELAETWRAPRRASRPLRSSRGSAWSRTTSSSTRVCWPLSADRRSIWAPSGTPTRVGNRSASLPTSCRGTVRCCSSAAPSHSRYRRWEHGLAKLPSSPPLGRSTRAPSDGGGRTASGRSQRRSRSWCGGRRSAGEPP